MANDTIVIKGKTKEEKLGYLVKAFLCDRISRKKFLQEREQLEQLYQTESNDN